jgi:phage/plasmid-like protein (TIGR03299 family)
MVANVETMMYQGATPWHRLGVSIPTEEHVNVDRALKEGGLDWKVEKRIMYTRSSLDDKYGLLTPIEDKVAIVRTTDEQVLGVVSEKYEVLQNETAFRVLDTVCDNFGVSIEVAGSLGKGEQVWMLAKLPESVEPMPGDKVNGYFLLSTGHNGLISYTARLTPIRVVCQNTLNYAFQNNEALVKLKHNVNDMEQMKMVEELITTLVQSLEITGDTFARLAEKQMDIKQVRKYINNVLGIGNQESILQQLGIDLAIGSKAEEIFQLVWNGKGSNLTGLDKNKGIATAWSAYNAVTEYIDHARIEKKKSIDGTIKASKSALFGPGAAMKTRAFNLALAA